LSGAAPGASINLNTEESRFLIAAGEAVAPTAMANTVAPAITGTAQQGSTLTTTNGTWTGSNGVITRRWEADHGEGYNFLNAVGTTYVPTAADVGATIRCMVRNINGAGAVYQASNVTAEVIAATPAVNTVAPAITGTAQAGETLTTTNGTWTGSDLTYARQWQANPGTGFVDIAAATGLTLVLAAGQVGSTIRCRVTATNVLGAVVANSNTTATVIAA
jgi:hypothetical protein